jgi:membrane protease YdiL (CAAX protease family)
MEAKQVKLETLFICLAAISCTEGLRWFVISVLQCDSMVILGLTRLSEAALILLIVSILEEGLSSVGLASCQMLRGVKKGIIWSAGFGMLVFSAFLVLFLFGTDPLGLIRTPLPLKQVDMILYFVVGVLVAPIAEEIFFRGILYGFFRRWGVLAALILSTFLFALPHLGISGLPITQVIGGILFAVAYEKEGSLMVPIIIHASGNMAIFSFSLLS